MRKVFGKFLVPPFLSLLLLFGCSYDKRKGAAPGGAQSGIMEAIPSGKPLAFKDVHDRIIGPKCLSCHSDSSGNQGGTNLESFENVKRLLGRVMSRAVEEKNMPPGSPLDEVESSLLKRWKEAGAPLASTEEGKKDERTVNWSLVQSKVLHPHCLDCHSPPDPEAGLDLTQLPVVRAKMPQIFAQAVILQNMPLSPYDPLNSEEKKIIADWVAGGMVE